MGIPGSDRIVRTVPIIVTIMKAIRHVVAIVEIPDTGRIVRIVRIIVIIMVRVITGAGIAVRLR